MEIVLFGSARSKIRSGTTFKASSVDRWSTSERLKKYIQFTQFKLWGIFWRKQRAPFKQKKLQKLLKLDYGCTV